MAETTKLKGNGKLDCFNEITMADGSKFTPVIIIGKQERRITASGQPESVLRPIYDERYEHFQVCDMMAAMISALLRGIKADYDHFKYGGTRHKIVGKVPKFLQKKH